MFLLLVSLFWCCWVVGVGGEITIAAGGIVVVVVVIILLLLLMLFLFVVVVFSLICNLNSPFTRTYHFAISLFSHT